MDYIAVMLLPLFRESIVKDSLDRIPQPMTLTMIG